MSAAAERPPLCVTNLEETRTGLSRWEVTSTLVTIAEVVSALAFLFFAAIEPEMNLCCQFHSLIAISVTGLLPFFLYLVVQSKVDKKIEELQEEEELRGNIYQEVKEQLKEKVLKGEISAQVTMKELSFHAQPTSEWQLKLSYWTHFFFEQLTSSPFSGEDGTLISSVNRGRKADIPLCAEPIDDSAFSQTARKRFGFTVTPSLSLKPFCRGVCCGSSFVFAGDFLRSGKIEQTAQGFQEGAPFAAVLLQAQYEKLASALHSFNPEEARVNRQKATAFFAGLNVTSTESCSLKSAISTLNRKNDGVYELDLPTYEFPYLFSCLGGSWANRHSVLAIKQGDTFAIFDPNSGTLIGQSKNSTTLLHKLFSSYHLTDESTREKEHEIRISQLSLIDE